MASTIGVDTIQNSTSGTTGMTIDTSGRTLTPARPAFSVFYDSSGTEGLGGNVTFTGVYSNIGSHYSTSTGLFTAPVAGFYHFNLVAFASTSTGGAVAAGGSTSVSLYDNTNSTTLARSYAYSQTGTSHHNVSFSSAHYLSASTAVRIVTGGGAYLYSDASDIYCKFSGFLVG